MLTWPLAWRDTGRSRIFPSADGGRTRTDAGDAAPAVRALRSSIIGVRLGVCECCGVWHSRISRVCASCGVWHSSTSRGLSKVSSLGACMRSVAKPPLGPTTTAPSLLDCSTILGVAWRPHSRATASAGCAATAGATACVSSRHTSGGIGAGAGLNDWTPGEQQAPIGVPTRGCRGESVLGDWCKRGGISLVVGPTAGTIAVGGNRSSSSKSRSPSATTSAAAPAAAPASNAAAANVAAAAAASPPKFRRKTCSKCQSASVRARTSRCQSSSPSRATSTNCRFSSVALAWSDLTSFCNSAAMRRRSSASLWRWASRDSSLAKHALRAVSFTSTSISLMPPQSPLSSVKIQLASLAPSAANARRAISSTSAWRRDGDREGRSLRGLPLEGEGWSGYSNAF